LVPLTAALRDRTLRLFMAAPGLVAQRRSGLALMSQRLGAGAARVVAAARGRAERVTGRVGPAPLRAALRENRAHLLGLGARLESASPLAILQRGYVLVTDPAGLPVVSAASVRPGGRLRLRFGDGQVDAVAAGGGSKGRAKVGQAALDL
jgi:exodeoxyribonuclease VII large subunit